MTPSEQPPEETFCLDCGPGAVLERHGGAVLHGPRCGIWQPVPGFPLRRALPGCDVFDTGITDMCCDSDGCSATATM